MRGRTIVAIRGKWRLVNYYTEHEQRIAVQHLAAGTWNDIYGGPIRDPKKIKAAELYDGTWAHELMAVWLLMNHRRRSR